MKRNRLIWLALMILSLVGITYYGGIVSYGFFFVMLFTPIVSLLYLVYVYFFFRVYQHSDGRTFVVEEPVPYRFHLVNEYHLPFVGVRVRFFSPFSTINGLSDQMEYELMPGTGITRETTIVCHYRGEYEIGIRQIELQDYFRLLKIKFNNKECKRVYVNPRIVFLQNLNGFEVQAQDSDNNPSKPDVLSREYVAGDDLRFINWSQTARTGNLMTRDRIGEEGNGVSVIIDTCRYSEDPGKYLPVENKILELNLAISLFYSNKKIATKEYYYYRQLVSKVVENSIQFDDLYKTLSELHFTEESTQTHLFEALLRDEKLFHSSVVYLVLPRWSKSAEQMVNQLTGRNIYTVIYLISEETEEQIQVSRTDLVEIVHLSPEAKLEEVFA